MSVNVVEKENKEKDLSTGQILLFKKMFSNGEIPFPAQENTGRLRRR